MTEELPDDTLIRIDYLTSGLFGGLAAILVIVAGVQLAAGAIIVAPFLLIGAFAFALMARSGVVIESDGVRARTFASSTKLTWDEIARFEVGGENFSVSLLVRPIAGGAIEGLGFAAPTDQNRERARQLVTALQARLDAERR